MFAAFQATDDLNYIDKLRNDYVKNYKNRVTSEGVGTSGDPQWGALRYSISQSYSAALADLGAEENENIDFIYDQVDYVLGSNSAKQSFVVGFCEGCQSEPEHPHHRGLFLNNNNVPDYKKNEMIIPDRNKQFGALVGGSHEASSYQDDINVYQYTEVCIDYNVGLVASLGYILSKIYPSDVVVANENVSKGLNAFSIKEINGLVTINGLNNKKFVVQVFDLNGSKIYSQKSSGESVQWSPSTQGSYEVVVLSEGSAPQIQKIIKR